MGFEKESLLFVPFSFHNKPLTLSYGEQDPPFNKVTPPTDHLVAVLYDRILQFPENNYGKGDLVLELIHKTDQSRARRLMQAVYRTKNIGFERVWDAANDPMPPEDSTCQQDQRIWRTSLQGLLFPLQYQTDTGLWKLQDQVLIEQNFLTNRYHLR
tara:strand:- start:2414 stop:2881 length:468 start_codon:yes stop_codon:yes gene_type:complete